MEMNSQEFKFFQHFLSQNCGIILSDTKHYLVKNRLSSLLASFNLSSYQDLILLLKQNPGSKVAVAVIDAMTTNETYWFRDENQFKDLSDTLLPLLAQKRSSLRIWSAACSTGQEPYSISMCIDDYVNRTGKSLNARIVGTDISDTVLAQAKNAVYTESALLRGIDSERKQRYFNAVEGGYKLKSQIGSRVDFQCLNLLRSFNSMGRFDIIFCRNVLIYFSDEVKHDILTRMLALLEPDGLLYLSSTEQMPVGVNGFVTVRDQRSRYYKKNSS
ncbi:MAG: protein-glutamate O-methyltransferase CheR [Methylicorpusculum sp.]|nr:protein-glutamate O-methyltransferase CheR [Methylicorpusculum sp.]MDO8843825.1 protein-glutamate O-methyltransferase CheR [Methylicorpusculum sp.]MDO8940224.1 protein-glutamate O-methyltransferase CheR [Methylicorpusculum sp.]MDO9239388.1 protein-glutamate O-methyltransferase CheR [Methylicorpusculum sp.]MDP2178199.1 protein-glutamate O-methyltransferase CheR [Methylicorpusculum sp.]MDP2201093.1 protein-glutamate O-methyltransferase CheR [Methylicorpusculum sp.]